MAREVSATNVLSLGNVRNAATGGEIIIHDRPGTIAPGVWLTGPVARRFPEHNWSGNLMVPTAAGPIEDNISEDMSLVINAKDGMVLVTGCGHAGIGNIMAQAREMMAQAPVRAVIGGLHLFEADDSKLAWTAGEMRKAGVHYLLAAHCTGIEATFRLRSLLDLERKNAVVAAVGASYGISQGINPLSLAR